MSNKAGRDWHEWHRGYDDPTSPLAERLRLVRTHIRRALDEAPPGHVRIVSICAGQGRDVLGAVRDHPRRRDVRARLVELDPRNVTLAREAAEAAGLGAVEVVMGDASVSDAYLGAAPAQIVLACGIFGNVTDSDIRRCIGNLPMLCDRGATVLWTRHRRPPDLTPRVRRWFAAMGFEEIAFESPEDHPYVSVGAARWTGERGVVEPGIRLFEFVADTLPAR